MRLRVGRWDEEEVGRGSGFLDSRGKFVAVELRLTFFVLYFEAFVVRHVTRELWAEGVDIRASAWTQSIVAYHYCLQSLYVLIMAKCLLI